MPPFRPFSIGTRPVEAKKRWIARRQPVVVARANGKGNNGVGKGNGGPNGLNPNAGGRNGRAPAHGEDGFDDDFEDGFDSDDGEVPPFGGGNGGSSQILNSRASPAPPPSESPIIVSFPAPPSRTVIEEPVRTATESPAEPTPTPTSSSSSSSSEEPTYTIPDSQASSSSSSIIEEPTYSKPDSQETTSSSSSEGPTYSLPDGSEAPKTTGWSLSAGPAPAPTITHSEPDVPNISTSVPVSSVTTVDESSSISSISSLSSISSISEERPTRTTREWSLTAGPAPAPTLTHIESTSIPDSSSTQTYFPTYTIPESVDPSATGEPTYSIPDSSGSTTRSWSLSAGPAPAPTLTHIESSISVEPTPTEVGPTSSDGGPSTTSGSTPSDPSSTPGEPGNVSLPPTTSIQTDFPTYTIPENGETGTGGPPKTTGSWSLSAGPAPGPTRTYVDVTTSLPDRTDTSSIGQPTDTRTDWDGKNPPSAGPAPGPSTTHINVPTQTGPTVPNSSVPAPSPTPGGDNGDDDGGSGDDGSNGGNNGGNNGGGNNGGSNGGSNNGGTNNGNSGGSTGGSNGGSNNGGNGNGNGGGGQTDSGDNGSDGGSGGAIGSGGKNNNGSGGPTRGGGFGNGGNDATGLVAPTEVVKQNGAAKTPGANAPAVTDAESTWSSDDTQPQRNKPANGDSSAEQANNPDNTYAPNDPLNPAQNPGGNVNYTGAPSSIDGASSGKKGPSPAVYGGAAAAGIILFLVVCFIFWRRHQKKKRHMRRVNPLLNTEAGGSGMFSPVSNRSQMSMVSNASLFYTNGMGTRNASRLSQRTAAASTRSSKTATATMEEKKAAGIPFTDEDENYVADGMREHGTTGVTLVPGGPLGYVGIREEDGVADGFQYSPQTPTQPPLAYANPFASRPGSMSDAPPSSSSSNHSFSSVSFSSRDFDSVICMDDGRFTPTSHSSDRRRRTELDQRSQGDPFSDRSESSSFISRGGRSEASSRSPSSLSQTPETSDQSQTRTISSASSRYGYRRRQ